MNNWRRIDVLVVNALRIAPHPTHQNLEEALAVARRIQAKKTYFIHMSHDMGLHAEAERRLPENIHLAFDGLEILSLIIGGFFSKSFVFFVEIIIFAPSR